MENYSVIANASFKHPDLEQIYMIQKYFPNQECSSINITRSNKDAIAISQREALKNDFLVVVGGDGTVNEVVRGILKSKANTPILLIPAGTCNDMGKNVAYHEPLKEYIKEALENIETYDIFGFNKNPFCYIAAGGYLMNVPYEVEKTKKQQLKKDAYILEMLKESRKNPPKRYMKINIDGKIIEGEYIAIIFSNTYSIGGLPIYEKSSLNDCKCELMLIKEYSKLKSILELYKVLKSEKRLSELSFIELYEGQNITVEMAQVFPHHFCLDGEQCVSNQKNIKVEPLRQIRIMRTK